MSMLDAGKTKELFMRVYNNKMVVDEAKGISDEKDIKELCSMVFGDGSVTPDPSLLHQFNNIVVATADEIAKPMVTNMLGYFAKFQTARLGDAISYKIPAKSKAKIKWAAKGTGVDLQRVEAGKKIVVVPTTLEAGFYYEPLDMVQDSVDNFRLLVQDIANAKVRLYFQSIGKLTSAAIGSGKIPAVNCKVGDNATIADFNKIASVIQRVGSAAPVFIGDSLMIDYFAHQQATDTGAKVLLSELLKDELRDSLNITKIGKTICINLVNPYIDDTNSSVELPVNKGYFLASETVKPFVIVEFGGLRQFTEQDPEDERIKIMLKMDAAVELCVGNGLGYIQENTACVLPA